MKRLRKTRIFEETDQRPLAKLMSEAFGFSEDFWKWKHMSYPNFSNSSIIVSESEGKIIGSSSWIPRDLKVSSSLVVKSALGGDTAVDPKYRGQGVGSSVVKFFDDQLRRNGIRVIYGFAAKEVAEKFYAPLGSILMRDSTTTFTKYLNCNQWREKIASLKEEDTSLRRRLGKTNLTIQFSLIGVPRFFMRVKNGQIDLEEVADPSSVRADVTIKGELNLFMPIFQGDRGVFKLVMLVLRRRIKTKGVLRNFTTLVRLSRIITPIFKERSS